MIKTETRTIGERGYTYTVQQLGARKGMRTLVRLAKLLGKPVGDAVSMGGSLDIRIAGTVISALAETITEDEFTQLCDTFAATSQVSGGNTDQATQLQYGGKYVPLADGGIFDFHFAGSYAELLGWLAFAVEVNYGSFLAVASKAREDLVSDLRVSPRVAGNAQASPSQST